MISLSTLSFGFPGMAALAGRKRYSRFPLVGVIEWDQTQARAPLGLTLTGAFFHLSNFFKFLFSSAFISPGNRVALHFLLLNILLISHRHLCTNKKGILTGVYAVLLWAQLICDSVAGIRKSLFYKLIRPQWKWVKYFHFLVEKPFRNKPFVVVILTTQLVADSSFTLTYLIPLSCVISVWPSIFYKLQKRDTGRNLIVVKW